MTVSNPRTLYENTINWRMLRITKSTDSMEVISAEAVVVVSRAGISREVTKAFPVNGGFVLTGQTGDSDALLQYCLTDPAMVPYSWCAEGQAGEMVSRAIVGGQSTEVIVEEV